MPTVLLGESDPPDVTDAVVALEFIQNDLRVIARGATPPAHADHYLPAIFRLIAELKAQADNWLRHPKNDRRQYDRRPA